jgi:hypothetical protein
MVNEKLTAAREKALPRYYYARDLKIERRSEMKP